MESENFENRENDVPSFEETPAYKPEEPIDVSAGVPEVKTDYEVEYSPEDERDLEIITDRERKL